MSSRTKSRIGHFLQDPLYRFKVMSLLGMYRRMSDEAYLKKFYLLALGKPLNLENPLTFNEKIQWLKLHDRDPLYTVLVDKFAVKPFVAERIGQEFVIPTLGAWDHASEIDYAKLPQQFVLKCTHDSGGVIICKDKTKLDIHSVNKKLEKYLKRDFYYYSREWPYKDVPRRIIAEPYLEDKKTGELRDYKFFCFDGEVRMLYVATGRQNHESGTRFDFFDSEYKHLEIVNGNPNADNVPEKPQSFDKMVEIARTLSAGFRFVRIDMYDVDGHPYFGEYTLYHYSGLVPFEPEEWDVRMGEWLHLR